jgi:hypothetical protein
MSAGDKFHIDEEPTYGVVLHCTDAELADQFEDFLSEKNFVLFSTKFQEGEVLFYFGLACSAESVWRLLDRFKAELKSDE